MSFVDSLLIFLHAFNIFIKNCGKVLNGFNNRIRSFYWIQKASYLVSFEIHFFWIKIFSEIFKIILVICECNR